MTISRWVEGVCVCGVGGGGGGEFFSSIVFEVIRTNLGLFNKQNKHICPSYKFSCARKIIAIVV